MERKQQKHNEVTGGDGVKDNDPSGDSIVVVYADEPVRTAEKKSSHRDYSDEELAEIRALLESNQVDPKDLQSIYKVKFGQYDQGMKLKRRDEEGKEYHVPFVHKLASTSIEGILKDSADQGEWPPLQPANSAKIIKAPQIKNRTKKRKDKTALIVTDEQIGFRRINGEMMPIHDDKAINIAQQMARYIVPDLIVFIGDNLDLPNMSKHGNDPFAMQTTNESIQYFHDTCVAFRAAAPDAQMKILEGNHEKRFLKYILENAPELAGLRPANAKKHIGATALAHFIGVDDFDAEYLPGYPANRFWINERLAAIHGDTVNSNGSTAYKLLANDPTSSVVFGHIHRLESHTKTVGHPDAPSPSSRPRIVSAHSFGTLSRIDGSVPSTKSGMLPDGDTLPICENWQQGVGVIEYKEGDHPFSVTSVPIHTYDGYKTHFDGKIFEPSL